MLYQILKPVVTVAVHIFYRNIKIVNREYLNQEGPTLIVSNHNNAFLDAVVVEMFARPQIYSVARGDVFKNRFVRYILNALRILPIFRRQDGVALMHKNEATFEHCVELLGQRQHIIMYPEGDCVMEKRLRKLRKGAARIALRAEAQHDFALNLRVLPVGLNYSLAKKFRSNLFINVGNPITLAEYKRQYQEDKVRAVNNLTLHIEKEMRSLIVEIKHHINDHLYENILDIYKPKLMQSLGLSKYDLADDHIANCHVAEAINYFGQHYQEQLEGIRRHLFDYQTTLNRFSIPQRLYTKQSIESLDFLSTARDLFLVGVGLPIHITGLLFNYLPYWFAYHTAEKKVKQVHFHASVNFVIGMFGWIFYYIFQLTIIAAISKDWLIVLGFIFFIPAIGWYNLHFYSFMEKVYARWNLFSFIQENKPLAGVLINNREELVNELDKAREMYCKERKGIES